MVALAHGLASVSVLEERIALTPLSDVVRAAVHARVTAATHLA